MVGLKNMLSSSGCATSSSTCLQSRSCGAMCVCPWRTELCGLSRMGVGSARLPTRILVAGALLKRSHRAGCAAGRQRHAARG